MTQLTHDDIQEEAFKVLASIAKLCDEYGLNYLLMYGTLLGAARHRGFIPWDDDIDIAMPRPDYEQLRMHIGDGRDDLRFFDHTTAENYPYLIGRVSSDGTRIHRDDEVGCGMGVFVDIYPIDALGDNYSFAVIKAAILGLLSSLYFASTRTKFKPYCDGARFKKAYVVFARAVGALRLRRLMRLVVNESKTGLNRKYSGAAVWMTLQSKRNVLPTRYFTDLTELEFQGRMFKAPKEYDKLLTDYYGDYMLLPPVDQQKPHHEYRAFYV